MEIGDGHHIADQWWTLIDYCPAYYTENSGWLDDVLRSGIVAKYVYDATIYIYGNRGDFGVIMGLF